MFSCLNWGRASLNARISVGHTNVKSLRQVSYAFWQSWEYAQRVEEENHPDKDNHEPKGLLIRVAMSISPLTEII